MALKITAINPTTQQATDAAYAKVGNFYRTGESGIQVHVLIFNNHEMRQINAQVIREDSHYIAIEDLKGDIMPAIYAVLKTFAQYEGAEDC